MPGFNLIKNNLIKPLLFATEKVFEQYINLPGIPEEQEPNAINANQSAGMESTGNSMRPNVFN